MISVDAYQRGFREIKLSGNQRAMLLAHYNAPDRRITMSRLAEAVGYPNHSAANLQYGILAKKLCLAMNDQPDDHYKDGSPFWLSIIAEAWKNKAGEFEFQMWPEVAEALERLEMV